VSQILSRRALAGLAATVAVVALSACAPIQAGSAAIVGTASLSENTLTQLSKEVIAVATKTSAAVPQPDTLNQRVVSVWVDDQLTNALATQLGVTASQTSVDNVLGRFTPDQIAQIQLQSGIAPSMLQDVARSAVLRQEIVQKLAPSGSQTQQSAALAKAYQDTASKLGVNINPRFGTWNPDSASIDPTADVLSHPMQLTGTAGAVGVLPPSG